MGLLISISLIFLQRATHIFATAHRRFDFAMAIGTLRNLDFCTAIQGQGVIFKWGITFCTGCIHCHTAFCTFIRSHYFPPQETG